MRKRLLFMLTSILCLYLTFETLNAQISDFKLSDFKLPDYKRQGIDLDFSLTGQSIKYDEPEYLSKNHGFSGLFNGNYYFYKNNRNYQGIHTIGSSLIGNYSKYSQDSITTKNNQFEGSLMISSSNLFYSKKQYFILIGFNGRIENSTKEYDYINSGAFPYKEIEKELKNKFTLSPTIGFGKGRIEPIEDARQALYILEELKKVNSLKHEPSNDEILQLAKRIAELKNERVLDSRIQKIRELTILDSLLQSLDLVNKTDISYFSNLNDMWDFGGSPGRDCGYQIGLYEHPSFGYSSIHTIDREVDVDIDSTINENSFRNTVSLDFSWNKPIRQKFQSNLWCSLNFKNWNDKNDPDYNHYYQNLTSSLGYSFGYYPNTRTTLVFGFRLDYANKWHRTEGLSADKTSGTEFYAGPYFSANYYFSPKLSFICSVGAQQSRYDNIISGEHQKSSMGSAYIHTGLVYRIF